MRAPAARRKPRKTQPGSFPVPTGGLISNRNIAMPSGRGQAPGAQVMDNWFPTASGAVVRRGNRRIATLPSDLPVRSIFGYTLGAARRLFAATDAGIWDITTIADPMDDDLPTLMRGGTTNGDWVVVQFSTPGGTFLIGVNGADAGFIFDGSTFEEWELSGVDTADLSHVWAYKQRLMMIERNSLDAWYLPVDQITGDAEILPLGGVFNRGGSLLWGSGWSLDSGGSGGLSEQCVFTTTEGEVAAYQGLAPDDAQTWSKVGTYRIGRPMGKKAFIRAGGDLVVCTSIGFIPLGVAIRSDYAALGMIAISNPISDEWARAVAERGMENWQAETWGEGRMVLVAPPTPADLSPVIFVSNTDTGAWCRFTGWRATSLEAFDARLYFGSPGGRVRQGWYGGVDEDAAYTATLVPLFSDLGTPDQRKFAEFARTVTRSTFEYRIRVDAIFDWDQEIPPGPDAAAPGDGSFWDVGEWDVAVWGESRASIVQQDRHSIGGSGYAMSLVVQVTSGSFAPLDVELVRVDFTWATGDVVT